MAITKADKQEILAKAEKALAGISSAVFVNFHGLNVANTTALRKELRAKGVGYFVAKKTLLRRVLEKLGFQGSVPELPGEIAVAYSADDLLAPAREVYSFEKKLKDNVSIVGGIFEGAYAEREKMVSIASIPPVQVLYGQLVNLINSPIQGLVLALNAIAESKGAAPAAAEAPAAEPAADAATA
ncbi:MAG TPA: 50S ribosomal protein L10 [Candidatus Paceibacterota bacterium]|nr:50S ribosomal protein L10 [Candidatus Paceibacterota bacterium]